MQGYTDVRIEGVVSQPPDEDEELLDIHIVY